MWHGFSGCGMASVGLAWAHWVWDSLSRCGMASVGVTWFGMVSVDVAWD